MGIYKILVVCAWAMEFLPSKLFEGQSDWFVKRGILWHIQMTKQQRGKSFKYLMGKFIKIATLQVLSF